MTLKDAYLWRVESSFHLADCCSRTGEDYEDDFGLYVPDAEINEYVARKKARDSVMWEWREEAREFPHFLSFFWCVYGLL